MKPHWKLLFIVLLLLNAAVWLAALSYKPTNFRLIACDVGQGDAILAISGTKQILTDGGIPNGKAVECLSRYMPFWDREVEVVINTHPQLDHYGGLIEVVQKYKVGYFVGNSLDSDSREYQVLKDLVGGMGIKVLNPVGGMSIRLGMMHYDIFFPSKTFLESFEGKPSSKPVASIGTNVLGTYTSKRDPNDFSVQAVLSYGNFDVLMTGDTGHNMADVVIAEFLGSKASKSIEYIKVSHHGSKYGITPDYLNVIDPKGAIISTGAKNTYGHPTKEILNVLNGERAEIYRTDIEGDIVIETDGTSFWKK
jgi:competence protein ComEC